MALSRKTKLFAVLGVVGLVLAFFGYEAVRVWWYRGFATGSRTGVVRKMSVKGPPYCKYVSGEMALQGTQVGVQQEIWEFSLDDDSEKNPLLIALHDAEKSGARVTLDYRQDKGSLFRCTPSEYFVTKVEK